MNHQEYDQHPHRRRNLLTGEWILVSPHRTSRPWVGAEEPVDSVAPEYDASCTLCPGNSRAGGVVNPEYQGTFVFTNDFPALLPKGKAVNLRHPGSLLQVEPEYGLCRVLCYSPRHDLTLCRLPLAAVTKVVETWVAEYHSLAALDYLQSIQIFENRGQLMGCSNPHPHGQIWANSSVPTLIARESEGQHAFARKEGNCLLCNYLTCELAAGERLLFQNDSFVALVPFWAVWPFEAMILPIRHQANIAHLTEKEKSDLAAIMIELGVCYDNLFQTSFPYSMGLHQAPLRSAAETFWHWHIHYYPPLLRSRTVKKHMVGYEMLAMSQRDFTAEAAAERLRQLPRRHYLEAAP